MSKNATAKPVAKPVSNTLKTTWEFIKGELTLFWERLGKDGAFSVGSDATSRYYSKVYQTFSSVQSDSRSFFYGKDRTHPGELGLWLDGLLQQIEAELKGAEFTENTFRKIGHISLIGKLAKLLFSQLDAGQNQTAEQRINESLLRGQFFRDNRGRIVEKCLASITAARSGDAVSMQVVSSMFRLLMAPTDDVTATPTTANQGQTILGAPEITAEYIRSMEVFYNAERVKRLANPEEHDKYPQWANEMYARELIWARMCLSLEKNSDPEMYVNMVKRSFNDTIISNSVGVLLAGSIHGLAAQCAAYPSDTVAAQLKALYRFVKDGDEYATVKNIPRLEAELGSLFAKRLQLAIDAYKVSTLPKSPPHLDFSNDVGLAFAHFNSIVKECFEQYGGFTTRLRRDGKLVLRKFEADDKEKQISLERCLSMDVDSTITGKNSEKSEDEIIARLSRISAVVAFLLTAQDSFDRAHIMYLDDRLLSNRNDEKQRKYDKKFLEVVRKDDAKFDVHSANRRINEIEKSEEIIKKLDIIKKMPSSVERPLLIASTTFSTVHQSKYGGTFIPPAGEIRTILEDLKSTFLKHDPNSSMCWLNYKGVAALKAFVEGPDGKQRVITYNMTIAQAALLMYIQERTFADRPVSWTDIAGQCWEKGGGEAARSLKENLGDLMNTKKGGKPSVPLIKPSNSKFDHSTILTLNSKFPMDKNTIDFAFKTKSSDDEDLSAARIDRIKVCMVRYMKANQRADYTTLSAHIMQEAPKFRMPEPSTSQIKKVLDMLMSGAEQYIRRDEEDNRTFVYIA